MVDLYNFELFSLIKQISELGLDEKNFNKIIEIYFKNFNEYEELIEQCKDISLNDFHLDNQKKKILKVRKQILLDNNSNRDFFTICSRTDFNELTKNVEHSGWSTPLIYHPLNDHSRRYLKKGDVLFCYRQGQFSNLSEALDTRGIYALGIAASQPLLLFPDETGHNQYGVVVVFPFKLMNHLTLRNIQLHPKTIDLTPYNGNRNDALQHISEEKHFKTIINLILKSNYQIEEEVSDFLDFKSNINFKLPSVIWNETTITEEKIIQDNFSLISLTKDLTQTQTIISLNFIKKYISLISAKNFVLLTGLSGSGKTQLALTFAKWISQKNPNKFNTIFEIDDEVKSDRVTYQVISVSSDSVTFEQTEKSTKVTLPIKLIEEWIAVIHENNFTKQISPREIRDIVGEKTMYSTQLNSFETHLKSAAFFAIERNKPSYFSQYCLVPVGADWTSREPLLGYPNNLESGKYIKPDNGVLDLLINAQNNPDLPFFLILDEMNLSHVERYFADFLSAMESKVPIPLHSNSEDLTADDGTKIPSEISIGDNLFIIGTVNIDETTYMFSPKVLDRAGVLEFRITEKELEEFLKNPVKPDMDKIAGKGASMAYDFLQKAKVEETEFEDKEKIGTALSLFFTELKKVGAEFGYRTASEIFQYAGKVKLLEDDEANDKEKWTVEQIIDTAVVQKLLPKLHGSRRKLEPVLKKLLGLCIKDPGKLEELLKKEPESDYSENTDVKYPISFEKLQRMHNRLIQDGFTSFAEA